jgi:hypothetical protein
MRDLIVTESITLDGVIEATGWFDPASGRDDLSDVEAVLEEQREAADAVLLGRVEPLRPGSARRRHDRAGRGREPGHPCPDRLRDGPSKVMARTTRSAPTAAKSGLDGEAVAGVASMSVRRSAEGGIPQGKGMPTSRSDKRAPGSNDLSREGFGSANPAVLVHGRPLDGPFLEEAGPGFPGRGTPLDHP